MASDSAQFRAIVILAKISSGRSSGFFSKLRLAHCDSRRDLARALHRLRPMLGLAPGEDCFDPNKELAEPSMPRPARPRRCSPGIALVFLRACRNRRWLRRSCYTEWELPGRSI